ncbi:hypothetical protein BS47DRAFT_1351076 [Hydnum rufescens UP504]|uniref:Uncharacterized protein n=1 Tax=Hydnum rufescens UP504 TaxID=1448309 RepID=A0A9P6AM22_9AGAM|nr:hypothetical protein BS47DRAFT_1351076 [Hydnum rufescens UP504]
MSGSPPVSPASTDFPPTTIPESSEKARGRLSEIAEPVEPSANATKEGSWPAVTDPRRLLPYRALSDALGFRERYSLIFFIVFGGAIVGLVLARSRSLKPNSYGYQLIPGEAFWANREPWKVFMAIHIILSFIGILLVPWQYIPAMIQENYMRFHRINGYIVLALLLPATLFGTIVSRKAFGGDIADQSGFYSLGILTSLYALEGMRTVHDIPQHRRWMLRFGALLGAVVTERLIILCAKQIISDVGSYYALWRCDELLYVVGQSQLGAYPLCLSAQETGRNLGHVQVAVHASTREAPINNASARRVNSGMAIWTALIIHMIGAEIYIRATEKANQYRGGWILGRPEMLPEGNLKTPNH